ncbi:MAG: hypothetical protein JSS50_01050 [Proteobacteria bacterium]|nr:hypothetical protein [Pseudomonadota bacterium]
MRKLYWLGVLAVLVVIVNFALWFWHTRVIINALENARYELRTHGIKMEYTEIKFTNFKAWELYGKVYDLNLTDPQRGKVLKLGEVVVESSPYERVVRLIGQPEWIVENTSTSTPTATIQEAVKMQFNSEPTVDIKFKKSVSDFNKEVAQSINGKSKEGDALRSVRDIVVNLGIMQAKIRDIVVAKWSNLTLESGIKIEPDKAIEMWEVRCSACSTTVNEYTVNLPTELKTTAANLKEQFGDISFSLDNRKIKTFSENTKAALKERLGDDVDLDEVGASFDSEYYENHLTVVSKYSTIKVESLYPIKGNDLQSKMVVDIEGYQELLSNIVSAINLSIQSIQYIENPPVKISSDPAIFAKIMISQKQYNTVLQELKQFEKASDQIVIQWAPYFKSKDTDNITAFASSMLAIFMPNVEAFFNAVGAAVSTETGKPQPEIKLDSKVQKDGSVELVEAPPETQTPGSSPTPQP